MPKKKILFEDVTPYAPAGSKPESPPSNPAPSSPPPEDTESMTLGQAQDAIRGFGTGVGAGAIKDAMNPPLEDKENVLNNGTGAVQGAINPEISKICDEADDKELCATTIQPLYSGKTDINSVMDMMVKGCETGVTEAKEAALKLKAEADASNVSSFDSCVSDFDEALDYLNQGLAALQVKDTATAQSQLSAAISLTSTCDDNFSDEPDPAASGENPMEKIDEKLINMIGNALAILNKHEAAL